MTTNENTTTRIHPAQMALSDLSDALTSLRRVRQDFRDPALSGLLKDGMADRLDDAGKATKVLLDSVWEIVRDLGKDGGGK
jgi:hypothetical protein